MANNLNEDSLVKKTTPAASPDKNTGIETDTSIVNLLSTDTIEQSVVDAASLDSFRTASKQRDMLYKIYDEMGQDSIISAALELYADDTAETNSKGEVVWVESDDPQIANMSKVILDTLKINENAWSHIYSLVKYGDVYLETFRQSDAIAHKSGLRNVLTNSDSQRLTDSLKNKKDIIFEDLIINRYKDEDALDDYIEAEPNPARIFELTQRGKTVGFVKAPFDATAVNSGKNSSFVGQTFNYNTSDIELFDPTKYVHILLQDPSNRVPERVRIFNSINVKGKNAKEKEKIVAELEYSVKRGKSVLYDVFKIYRELKLLEDSLLLNRLTRSSFVRILQVEVGEMGKAQVSTLLRRIKQYFEQKTAFQEGAGGAVTSYNNPEPIVNNIYLPTRDGKGGITASDLGGDVDVGQLTDIDYFTNLLFAGLKIPKQFLNFTDDATGFNGGTSLVKISSRYAKTIKRIQNSYSQGIKTLLNIIFIDRGLSNYVNNFTVKMQSPSTIEDSERAESVSTNTDIIANIMGLLTDIDDETTKLDMLNILLKEYLNIPDLVETLEDFIKKHKIDEIAGDAEEKVTTDEIENNIDTKLQNVHPETSSDIDVDVDVNSEDTITDTEEDDEELPNPKDIDVDFSMGDGTEDTEEI